MKLKSAAGPATHDILLHTHTDACIYVTQSRRRKGRKECVSMCGRRCGLFSVALRSNNNSIIINVTSHADDGEQAEAGAGEEKGEMK